jgi:hypothetical protein
MVWGERLDNARHGMLLTCSLSIWAPSLKSLEAQLSTGVNKPVNRNVSGL